MSAELSIAIKLGASVGGAVSAIRTVLGGTRDLGSSTQLLRREYHGLGRTISQVSATGSADLHRLQQQQQSLNKSLNDFRRRTVIQAGYTTRLERGRVAREQMKSEVIGAFASVGTVLIPIKAAMNFESAMADVRKVVDFDTPQQFKEMEQQLLSMTHKIPMSANELAKIAASGGQLGIARQDIAQFTETIAKMSVAFDMSAEQAGDSMAKLANVYQIPIAKINELGDAINHLSNNSPAKASDIVNTLGRVGGVAKQFGLTELQTASLANAFISLGKTPEVAGTAINAMLTKLMTADKAPKKFQEALAGMGISVKQLKKDIAQNGEQALMDFLKTINKLPKDQQMGTLVDLFGLEYADDVAVLTGSLETYQKAIDLLGKDENGKSKFSGSMEAEFAERAKTTANNWQLLKSSLIELGITIGTMLLPTVNRFVEIATRMVNALTDWGQQHSVLTKAIVGTIAAILAFISGGFLVRVLGNRIMAVLLRLRGGFAALSATITLLRTLTQSGIGFAILSGNLGKIMHAFTAIRTAMMGIGLSSALAFAPVLLAIAAVAAAAALIYIYWKPIKAFFIGFWDGFKDGIAPILPLLEMIGAGWKGLFDLAVAFVQPIIAWFRELGFVSDETAQKSQSIGYFFGAMLGTLLGNVQAIGDAIINGWRMIFDSLFNVVFMVIEQVKTAWLGGLSSMVALVMNWSILGAIRAILNAIAALFGGEVGRWASYGANMIDGLINGISAGIGRVVAMAQNLAARVKSAFTGAMQIHSPSRVFRSYGGFMTEGLAIGVNKGEDKPIGKIRQLASNLKNRFAERMGGFRSDLSARLSANADNLSQARAEYSQVQFNNGGAMTIHFNPTINAAGGNPQQIETALQMGLREFEDFFKRMMADQQRRAY